MHTLLLRRYVYWERSSYIHAKAHLGCPAVSEDLNQWGSVTLDAWLEWSLLEPNGMIWLDWSFLERTGGSISSPKSMILLSYWMLSPFA